MPSFLCWSPTTLWVPDSPPQVPISRHRGLKLPGTSTHLFQHLLACQIGWHSHFVVVILYCNALYFSLNYNQQQCVFDYVFFLLLYCSLCCLLLCCSWPVKQLPSGIIIKLNWKWTELHRYTISRNTLPEKNSILFHVPAWVPNCPKAPDNCMLTAPHWEGKYT